MADIFRKKDARKLLEGNFVLLIGDSNMRDFYRDLLSLIVTDRVAETSRFKNKNRYASFLGDKVVSLADEDSQGRDYHQIREFKEGKIHLMYHFVTRAYGPHTLKALERIQNEEIPTPSVIIMNSCVWDLTRWGPQREDKYKEEIVKLFSHFQRILSDDTLVMWTTTLPLASHKIKGGVLIKQLDFVKHSMRFMIMEANFYIQQLCVVFGIDVLDLHYHLRNQIHWRSNDGLHWEPPALRHVTNLILTHIALAFDEPLPNNFVGVYRKHSINRANENSKSDQVNVYFDDNMIHTIKNALTHKEQDEPKKSEDKRRYETAKRRLPPTNPNKKLKTDQKGSDHLEDIKNSQTKDDPKAKNSQSGLEQKDTNEGKENPFSYPKSDNKSSSRNRKRRMKKKQSKNKDDQYSNSDDSSTNDGKTTNKKCDDPSSSKEASSSNKSQAGNKESQRKKNHTFDKNNNAKGTNRTPINFNNVKSIVNTVFNTLNNQGIYDPNNQVYYNNNNSRNTHFNPMTMQRDIAQLYSQPYYNFPQHNYRFNPTYGYSSGHFSFGGRVFRPNGHPYSQYNYMNNNR